MKQFLMMVLGTVFCWNYCFAQCNPYYDFKAGSEWETTSYNKNDKVTGRQVNILKSLEETSDGWTAQILFKSYDQNDELVFEKEMELACEAGIIKMDMERFIPEESLKAFKELEIAIEADNLSWPSDLSVGKTLDDAAVNITSNAFNMSINIVDRKVEGKEVITTPAGTFNTFRVSSTINTKMMMDIEMKAIDFIAEEVGIVKSVSYDRSGKINGYTLLTNYK